MHWHNKSSFPVSIFSWRKYRQFFYTTLSLCIVIIQFRLLFSYSLLLCFRNAKIWLPDTLISIAFWSSLSFFIEKRCQIIREFYIFRPRAVSPVFFNSLYVVHTTLILIDSFPLCSDGNLLFIWQRNIHELVWGISKREVWYRKSRVRKSTE